MSLNSKTKKILGTSLLALFISSTLTIANAKPGGRQGPPTPPEEALTACSSLSEGEACSFTTSEGDAIKGSCKAPPHGGQGPLACAPAGGPPRR